MTIDEILDSASKVSVSSRFRKWLSFILSHDCILDEAGNIIPHGMEDGRVQFAGIPFSAEQAIEEVSQIPSDRVVGIYSENYWWPAHAETLPSNSVGECVATFAVDCGLEASSYILQDCVSNFGVKTSMDGKIGPKLIRDIWHIPNYSDLSYAIVSKAKSRYKKLARCNPEDLIALNKKLERAEDLLRVFH